MEIIIGGYIGATVGIPPFPTKKQGVEAVICDRSELSGGAYGMSVSPMLNTLSPILNTLGAWITTLTCILGILPLCELLKIDLTP